MKFVNTQKWENGRWNSEINVRDFIQKNYTPYNDSSSFLQGPTEATKSLWNQVLALMKQEQKKGILDTDIDVVSSITAHGPGYIDHSLEKIVGLQTDRPLKRGIVAYGGVRMAES